MESPLTCGSWLLRSTVGAAQRGAAYIAGGGWSWRCSRRRPPHRRAWPEHRDGVLRWPAMLIRAVNRRSCTRGPSTVAVGGRRMVPSFSGVARGLDAVTPDRVSGRCRDDGCSLMRRTGLVISERSSAMSCTTGTASLGQFMLRLDPADRRSRRAQWSQARIGGGVQVHLRPGTREPHRSVRRGRCARKETHDLPCIW